MIKILKIFDKTFRLVAWFIAALFITGILFVPAIFIQIFMTDLASKKFNILCAKISKAMHFIFMGA